MKVLPHDSCVSSSEETCIKTEPFSLTEVCKSEPAESTVTTIESDNGAVPNQSGLPSQTSTTTSPPAVGSKLAIVFPWISEFSKFCRASIGLTSIQALESLMTVYIGHVSSSVSDCHLKPNRASNLKRMMNNALLLFHFFYSDIKKPLEHSSYLDKMSDLLAMYIDMEIMASRRSKESLPKVASKLTSALFVFLDRSQDHILDSIFKTKYMNKNYWELCNLIFSRVLRDSPGRAVYEMTYVRYVFAFKMWKRIVRGPNERRNIVKLATLKLHPPPQFREKLKAGMLSGILPKISRRREDITMFLMQAKFCIKEKTKAFLKAVADPNQHAVLSSHLVADLESPLLTNIDTSPHSLADDQEEPSSSTMLINDIWTSPAEPDVINEIRLTNMLKNKKVKAKCKKVTNKNESASVLEDKNRKKKKICKEGEDISVESVQTSNLTNICAKTANVTKDWSKEQPLEPIQGPVREVESFAKHGEKKCAEAKLDERPGLTLKVKSVDQVNQVDSACERREERYDPVKAEVNHGCDDISDNLDVHMDGVPHHDDTIKLKSTEKLYLDSNQVLIQKMLESLKEQSRLWHPKKQVKPQINCKDLNIDVVSKPDSNSTNIPNNKSKQDEILLHNATLRLDFEMFLKQQRFRTNCLKETISPGSSVPSPVDKLSVKERCMCLKCSANLNVLSINYKILAQFMENKQNIERALQERIKEPVSCLPLKKRKNVSLEEDYESSHAEACSRPEEKLEFKTPAQLKSCTYPEEKYEFKTPAQLKGDISYPCKPMMSIAAMMEGMNEISERNASSSLAYVGNKPSLVDYSDPVPTEESKYSFISLPNLETKSISKDFVVPHSSFPPYTGLTTLASCKEYGTPPEGAYPLAVPSSQPETKTKLKTLAQLKESYTNRPALEITAAQSLIHFANNSHNLCPVPENEAKVTTRQSKNKTKSDKSHSRKKNA